MDDLKAQASSIMGKQQPFNNFINKNRRKDGRLVWLSSSGLPIIKDGQVVGYRGADLNITSIIEVQEAMQLSEKKYREMIDAMNDAVWLIDDSFRIIDANNAAVKYYGYSKEELLKLTVFGLDRTIDFAAVTRLHQDTSKGSYERFEREHTCKDGRKIQVEISLSKITYSDKKSHRKCG